MSVIKVSQLTKKYGKNKGVFELSFDIRENEVFGFLGPNGAGKTTTIRHLLGFSKPQSGMSSILDLNSWEKPKEIQTFLGYLPAEIAFPSDMTGIQFIQYIAKMRGLRSMDKAKQLIAQFELDPSGVIKRMSKGMKQKIGIVCAFMHDPKVLILDEPTTGLDPLMQSVFLDLIKQEKKNGKSILMSSHLFEEIEDTCDRIGIIKQGRLLSLFNTNDIRHIQRKTYKVEFLNQQDFDSMKMEAFTFREVKSEKRQIVVDIEDAQINELLSALSKRRVKFVSEMKYKLEEYFMGFYKGENQDDVQ
jgi:ABC-2 type transport system ATP-binding protein